MKVVRRIWLKKINVLLSDVIRKEGNVLFNNTLNTFILRLFWHQIYGKGPLK